MIPTDRPSDIAISRAPMELKIKTTLFPSTFKNVVNKEKHQGPAGLYGDRLAYLFILFFAFLGPRVVADVSDCRRLTCRRKGRQVTHRTV